MDESKSLFVSKSFWGAVLVPILSWAAARYGLDLGAEEQTAIVAAASAVAGIVLRKITRTPVHIVGSRK